MNSQQNSQQISNRSKKIATLFLMLEAFKTNNRHLDMNVINTTHLLTFNQAVMNTAIPFFAHINLIFFFYFLLLQSNFR